MMEILLKVVEQFFVTLKTAESTGGEQQGNDLIDHLHSRCFSPPNMILLGFDLPVNYPSDLPFLASIENKATDRMRLK